MLVTIYSYKFLPKIFDLVCEISSIAMGKDLRQEQLIKFGENLRKLRLAKGLTLRDMSALCKFEYTHIGEMERGERNVTFTTIMELAEALEVKPRRLFEFE
jgi:DNA-binding Xre family transcriptional regulator